MGRKTMSKRRILAVLAGLLLASLPTAKAAEEPTPEGRFARWFVELPGAPATQGGDTGTLEQEKGAFRSAARKARLRYEEEFAYSQLWNGLAIEIAPGDLGRLSRIRSSRRDPGGRSRRQCR